LRWRASTPPCRSAKPFAINSFVAQQKAASGAPFAIGRSMNLSKTKIPAPNRLIPLGDLMTRRNSFRKTSAI